MIEIIITENEMGQRLDRYLLKLMHQDSRNHIYKYLRKKIIKVNGRKADESYFLALGDQIQIYLPEDFFSEMTRIVRLDPVKDYTLDIVFEDQDLLVLNKPGGLLTHPDQKEYKKTLSSYVSGYLKEYAQGTFRPAPIQRLDKNTSGIVIFAKNYETLKTMNRLMRERKIKKMYLGVVQGSLSQPMEIKGYLEKDPEKNRSAFRERETPEGKWVHSSVRPLKTGKDYTLVEIELHTGRSHQIRASLGAVGHPLVGDGKYGGRPHPAVSHYLLHAYRSEVEGRVFEAPSEAINSFCEREIRE